MASGRFIPKHPQKYVGNPNNIMFRSSWELRFFQWLDRTDAVIRWGSEELAIPYVHPIDKRVHRYFPDVIVWYKNTTGNIVKEIIEIKPYKESVPTPRMSERDAHALAVNQAKWQYASDFATRNGATFRVLTERSMFRQGTRTPKRTGSAV